MTGYTAMYPINVAVDDKVKKFIEAFYAVSDDEVRNVEWVDCFADDAILIMGDKRAEGIEEIRQLREGMWEMVKSRRHKLDKVFPATFEIPEREHKIGSGGRFEYMLNGTVDLEMKSGEKTAAQWAGRAVLGEVDGKLKYLFYQVFLRFMPA